MNPPGFAMILPCKPGSGCDPARIDPYTDALLPASRAGRME